MRLPRELKKKMDADVNIKKALAPNIVGGCIHILEVYLVEVHEPTFNGFKEYYLKHQGKKGLLEASEMIVAEGYDLQDAKSYVYIRVFQDTWKGKKWEVEVMDRLSKKGLYTYFSTKEEDRKYCVDLIGGTFAVQVKPISYFLGSNPSLLIDKELHKKAQQKYEEERGGVVIHAFYDKDTGKIFMQKEL